MAKILVVDDEKGWLELLSYELSDKGHHVVTAVNGKEAISKSSKENFHLVVSDFKMPGMDGIETLRAIKEIQPKVKTVLMTAYIFEPKIQKELRLNNIDCLDKPLIVQNLIPTICGFLK